VELHQRLLLRGRRGPGRLLPAGILLLAAAAAQAADFANLARLAGQGARVTAAVWDLSADQSIAQLEPAQRLTPASISKIVIAAAALDTWPPDHTFATELRAAASPVDGVVGGDLVLRSEGDATLDETTLWGLAAQLRSLGVKRVAGRLLVERAPFGELGCDTVDRCNAMRRSARAYNASPSAIGVNYGSWCINVRAPAGAAARAEVNGCASGELPIPLTGAVRIAAGGPALAVERTTGPQGDAIAVSGSIAPGEERSVHRAMSDPAAGAGQILRSILRQAGIGVEGGVETTGAAHAPRLLAKVDGLLLQEQVGRMMRWSNNYIADVLTMGVALQRRGSPPASLAAAAGELTAYLARNSCCGAAPGAVMESGSGLTTSNRLSALDLVAVLRAGYRDTRAFPAFYGSFVVPGDASFAYLRSGNADWQRRVALKTGSLTEPVSVNGIAGYLRRKDGGWMAFAVIVNGTDRLQVPHDRALAAARADIEALLAKY
jgi:D-alanyl-D-alanine carboxypeptidase/D-alanyl-D-alanine-endopeptidase (penicillin-binding protein 4)